MQHHSPTVPAAPVPPVPDRHADDTGRAVQVHPASFAQQRLWFLSQLPGGSSAYNETVCHLLSGPLRTDILAEALTAMTARHEALRTRLVETDGAVWQHVDPPGSGYALSVEDLTGADDPDARLAAVQVEEAEAPFDLAAGPLARGRLVLLGPDRHALLLTFHHAVYDGRSMDVMMRELGAIYEALLHGDDPGLPLVTGQYTDYVRKQREAALDGGLAEQEAYWQQALDGAPPVLDLPTDRPRPPEQSFAGGRVGFALDTGTTAALRALARKHGATLFVTLLTGWAVLLSRLSGSSDIVIGGPVANRRGPAGAGLIGFLVNSLPLRVDLSGSPTAAEALVRTKAVVRSGLAHQDLPFERIVELVNPPRTAACSPLFQTMLAWSPERGGLLRLPGVRAEPLPIDHSPAKFDLALSLADTDQGLVGHLDYATALFDDVTARRWADHLARLLADMARHPERDVAALELMGEAEQRELVADWDAATVRRRPDSAPRPSTGTGSDTDTDTDTGSGTGAHPGSGIDPGTDDTATAVTDPASAPVPFRTASGIAELFEAQVRARPAQRAVVCGDRSLDYASLDRRANRLAHALAARSVRPGDVVGLHLGRSVDLAVGVLGVLKAGAAYLPLDPALPVERLAGMAEDADCPLVLSDQDLAGRPDRWRELGAVEAEGGAGERAPVTDRSPDSLAYVIFTSGSTGRPKGVAVEHGSVLNLFDVWQSRMGAPAGEVGSAWSSIGFDASVHELLLPLTTGGELHIVPEELRGDPAEVLDFLREHAVEQVFLPPAYVRWIDEAPAERLRGLRVRTLLTGVESLTEAALYRMTRLLPGLRICFGYGPTEATLYSTAYYDPRPVDRPCPIGRPLPGTRLYVLDARMRPVPPGVVGEVYLGGAGLARGYLGRPELTEERFPPDPFVAGERVYRTGDLARRLPDGQAHYVGRGDDQVKLRGFRIEPGEVEAALVALPEVREAVVLADRDAAGQQRLVAGIGRGDAPARDAHGWRTALARRLPDYMIPAVFVELPELPLNRSGKPDRAELLRLARELGSDQVNTATPRDHVEHALYRIWREILPHPAIGVTDNFFDVGGTSLSAIKVAHAVAETFGRRVPVAEIMLRPTIEALGGLLREGGADRAPGSVVEFRAGPGARVVCVHPAGGTAFCYLPLAAHLPETAGVYGVQSPGVNPGEELLPTVTAMAEEYLRLLGPLDGGPVVLTGLSYGGLVAHEMGRLLAEAGRTDVSVVLLDTQATDDEAARAGITAVDMAEFRDKLVRFNGMYPGIDDAQVERYFRIYNHNRLTARAHVPAASAVRVVLAEAVPGGTDTELNAEARAFWASRARGDFRVETLECDHWEVLEIAGAVRVADILAAELAHHEGPSGTADAVAPRPASAAVTLPAEAL
ncbi:amino acid adenylation domain-containing protein [Streptomyces sp. NPDC046985]|uniref:non-ribosomal peptide synthetase n=1 Tax=Streptomyces sp. NPDC046985 TaxID=3155377 RepID=UPI0033CA2716